MYICNFVLLLEAVADVFCLLFFVLFYFSDSDYCSIFDDTFLVVIIIAGGFNRPLPAESNRWESIDFHFQPRLCYCEVFLMRPGSQALPHEPGSDVIGWRYRQQSFERLISFWSLTILELLHRPGYLFSNSVYRNLLSVIVDSMPTWYCYWLETILSLL